MAVRDDRGRVALLVVVKARRGADGAWAAEWRAFFLDGLPPPTRDTGMLLATPDALFYWAPGAATADPPIARIEAAPLLSPYLSSIATGERVDPLVFEWAVSSWLEDLLAGDPLPIQAAPLAALLSQLGPGARVDRGRPTA